MYLCASISARTQQVYRHSDARNTIQKPILSADRYSAYKALENQGFLRVAYCWAHQRRDFVNLIKKYPNAPFVCDWAKIWVKRIGHMYRLNNLRTNFPKDSPGFLHYQKKLDKLLCFMFEQANLHYENEVQNKIMQSMKKHWQGLVIFAQNPEIAIDNNIAERELRHVVLARKNYNGSRSPWSSELAAAMFSIIKTCLHNAVSPKDYLYFYFQKCTQENIHQDTCKLLNILPHRLDKHKILSKTSMDTS